jgi:hypothetical protein
LLFEGDYQAPNGELHVYDVLRDGQRFLMFKRADEVAVAPEELVIAQNWLVSVRRLIAAQ